VSTAALGSLIVRPHLEARLDEAFGKRLTLVVAGAGYGKSTLVDAWAADLACAWYTAAKRDRVLETFAAGLRDSVPVALEVSAPWRTTSANGGVATAESAAASISRELEQALSHDLLLVIPATRSASRDLQRVVHRRTARVRDHRHRLLPGRELSVRKGETMSSSTTASAGATV
jgi:predicted ATPase